MTGKGSVNHNSRKFHAKNTDPERSYLNIEYINENIEDVYHELFDEALARYNEKQSRKDRCIDNYYEKIRSGKQEKTFHEIILQIGDKDNMGAKTEDGQLAAKILNEYMQDFQQRNPTLRVFSAYLHMDEATPHLHIDFVPYTTESKRGLDTRVSLKQALSALGFKGGTRRETELNQWVAAEKKQLAAVMERHGIEWEQKGTHEKHLSVLDFEKQERAKEVAALEKAISGGKRYYKIFKFSRQRLCRRRIRSDRNFQNFLRQMIYCENRRKLWHKIKRSCYLIMKNWNNSRKSYSRRLGKCLFRRLLWSGIYVPMMKIKNGSCQKRELL